MKYALLLRTFLLISCSVDDLNHSESDQNTSAVSSKSRLETRNDVMQRKPGGPFNQLYSPPNFYNCILAPDGAQSTFSPGLFSHGFGDLTTYRGRLNKL